MRNKTLCSRLGFLLEKYQMQTGGLKKHISTSFVSLDPDRPKTKIWDRRWRVRVNVSLQGEDAETKKVVVPSKYDDVPQFVLTVLGMMQLVILTELLS